MGFGGRPNTYNSGVLEVFNMLIQAIVPADPRGEWYNKGSMINAANHKTAKIDQELKARGYRLTPRRLMVVEVLAAHGGHLTVEEILAHVAVCHPSTNKTTVYRTLELLTGLGMVVTTDLGSGRLEYELQSHPHHHLICEKCHARIEVEDSFLEPLRSSLLQHYGFTTNLDHFALFGVCPECSR